MHYYNVDIKKKPSSVYYGSFVKLMSWMSRLYGAGSG